MKVKCSVALIASLAFGAFAFPNGARAALPPRATTSLLAFQRGATNGEFTFDTGVLRGKLRAGGKSLGLSSVTHLPTGTVLDRSMGLFSHYRLFTTGKRYGGGVWDMSSTATLRADGSVEMTLKSAPDRPFEIRAIYHWHDAATLDLETIVKAERDLAGFEVFLASYFAPQFTNALVFATTNTAPKFIRAEKSTAYWQMFARDPSQVPMIKDGRWAFPPNPVEWTICGRLAQPLAVRRAPELGLNALFMAPAADCFAIATPYESEPHYSMYLSLFGRDIKAGETARAQSRLVIRGPTSDAEIAKLYNSYTDELAVGAQAGPLLTQTDVFISGKDGYHTYRIPAIEAAPDGSLVAFAEARKYNAADPGFGKQDIDLVFKRSTNNGASWSSMTVIEDPGELWSAANPSTLVDRTNGRLWVFYLRSRPGRSTDTSRPGTDDMQTQTRWSDDNGRTWSDPLDLTSVARDMNDKVWRASVPGPGGAIQTRKGRLIVPMWKTPFANFAIFSDDHGRTWQRSELVPGRQGGDENQLVELTDGRILMDIRQNSGPHRWLSESADGGQTWAEPRPGLTVTPVMCAIEGFTLNAAGEKRDRILWTGPKGPDRRRLVIRTSGDEGRTFPNERLISNDYAAYSDLAILKDKTVGVLWERGVERGYQFLTFTRLNQEWIDAASAQTNAPSPASFYKVISRGEAAATYQAFTDICRLKNGDLLCVFYAGYGHVSLPRADFPKGGRICSVRSSDEGRNWSAPRILFDSPSDDRDPHIAQMRGGDVVCSFFTYRPQPNGKVLCDTCLVTSHDGGETWDLKPQVVAPGWPSSAPVRELPDGTRILGVYHEEGATAYGGVIRSTDGGKTWREPIPIGKGSGVRLDAETDFVRLKDGSLYAALRGDRVNMHFATSPDGGLTWSQVKDIGFPGHCPHFTRLSTGEILLTHRLPLTALHVSRDEAKTWQGPYQIDTTPGAYPSTVELKDGTVLVVYYEEGAGSAVRARRFKLKEDGIEFLPFGSP